MDKNTEAFIKMSSFVIHKRKQVIQFGEFWVAIMWWYT